MQKTSIDALASRTEGGLESLIWGDDGLGSFMEDLGCRAVPSTRPQVLYFKKLILHATSCRRAQNKEITMVVQSRTRLFVATVPEMVPDRFKTI